MVRQASRRNVACENCGDAFVARINHGSWPRFCSRACFLAHCETRTCAHCGETFAVSTAAERKRHYCSTACRYASRVRMEARQCLICSKPFLARPSDPQRYCSPECSPGHFKGGRYLASLTENVMVRHADRYIGEHRLIAAEAIGRPLRSEESVIRLAGDRHNDPANLFICASRGELIRRFRGWLPWPARSNLKSYGRGPSRRRTSDLLGSR